MSVYNPFYIKKSLDSFFIMRNDNYTHSIRINLEEVDKLIDDLKQASVELKAERASKLTNSYATPDKDEVLEELRRDIVELKRRVRRLE